MRKSILALALSCLVAGSATAQDINDLAREYMGLPAVQEMMTDMFSPGTMGQQFVNSLPPGMSPSDEQVAQIGVILSEAMGEVRPDMESLMERQSAVVFTEAELQAMIDFYGSDIGASILKKNTSFFTATMAELNPKIIAAVQMRQGDIMQVLQGSE
jgi:hypothetical protein